MKLSLIDKLPQINNINNNFKTHKTLNLKKKLIIKKNNKINNDMTKKELKQYLRIKNLNINNEYKEITEEELNYKFDFVNTGDRYNISDKNQKNEFNNTLKPNKKIEFIIENWKNDYSIENWKINKDDLLIIIDQDSEFLIDHDNFEDILKVSLYLLKYGLIEQQCSFFNCICFLFKAFEIILLYKDNDSSKLLDIFFDVLKYFLEEAEQYLDLLISSIIIFLEKLKKYLNNFNYEFKIKLFDFYLYVLNIIIEIIKENKNILTTNNLISTKLNYGKFWLMILSNYNFREILFEEGQLKLNYINIIKKIKQLINLDTLVLNNEINFNILDLIEIYYGYSYYFKKDIDSLIYFDKILENKEFIVENNYILKKIIRINKYIRINLKDDIWKIMVSKLFFIIQEFNEINKSNYILLLYNSILFILENIFYQNIKLLKQNKRNLMIFLNYINKYSESKIKEALTEKIINLTRYIN